MIANIQDNDVFYESLENQKKHIRRIEESVKKKPSSKDKRDSVKILKDFGITIDESDIPNLRSVCELEKWRIRIICEYFNSH